MKKFTSDKRGTSYAIPVLTKRLALAIEAAGSRRKLALAIGVDPATVFHWDKVPAERLLDIERVTRIPRHELRPDLFVGYTLYE